MYIRNSSTISCFRRQLKTFYKAAFRPPYCPIAPPAHRLRFGRSIADIMHFTNSFTYLVSPGCGLLVHFELSQSVNQPKHLYSAVCHEQISDAPMLVIGCNAVVRCDV